MNLELLRQCRERKENLSLSAASYLHLHANRLLRSAHHAQEVILYDFLARLYESRTGLWERLPHEQ
jgi:hypothetical protein